MILRRMFRRKPGSRKGFLCNRSGMAAVEFALMLPLMVLMYLGSVEVGQAIAIDRMVTLTATTLTNVVTQYTTISATADIPDILGASASILTPYSASNAKVVLTSVVIDVNGNATVSWSKAQNGAARVAGSSVTVPSGMATPNSSLILGEVSYAYSPVIDILKIGPFSLSQSIFMVPRSSGTIVLTP